MAEQQQSGEKTEEPTERKKEQSRKKGHVWKSRDLSAAAVFIGGMALVKVTWPFVETEINKLFHFGFDIAERPEFAEQAVYSSLVLGLISLALLSIPISLGAAIFGGLAEFIQVGPVFAAEGVIPKLEKINPAQGFKNLFSKKQIVELVKSTAKVFLGAYLVYVILKEGAGLMSLSVRGDINTILQVTGELMFQISVQLGLLFLAFAIFDVWWQRKVYLKDLMMTKDEVKREYKETEGDPQYKARRKELHQEILDNIQMESVKDADVVVTNPDHVAVALRYDRQKDRAPRVMVKGVDFRAEAIKAIAKEHGVVMTRNVPLAHALLRVDAGDEIPESLYDAVAEVLNFVYRLRATELQ